MYCKIFARFHSLTEMSRDQNGQTKSARPTQPDRIGSDRNGSDRNGSDRNGQTQSARPKRPDWKVLFRHR